MRAGLQAVLFDLDGCLIDSAPDLAGTVDDLRAARGLAPLPYATLRPHVGSGARGMLGVGLGLKPDDPAFVAVRDEFLDRYAQRLLQLTQVFPAVAAVLDALDAAGVPWGIVTNKASRFAAPIAQALGLQARARALVCGDTTPHAKPHPEPLWEAARRLGLPAAQIAYVGDDHRDMRAAQAAGMPGVAAGWGYLGDGLPIEAWGASVVVPTPADLQAWLQIG